jgi:hypothetical protein
MRAALACAAALALAGCGTNPQDHTTRVALFSAHVGELSKRASSATATGDRSELQELLAEARLAQEDIEQTVPIDEPGRDRALLQARTLVRRISGDLAQVPR